MLSPRCLVRDSQSDVVLDRHGEPVPDKDRRDTENVPLTEYVAEYLEREVLPHVPDAHVADPEGKFGYEIPFTRLFYEYTPPRPSGEIKAELRERERRVRKLLEEVLV